MQSDHVLETDLVPGFGVSLKHTKVSSFRVHCDADSSVNKREPLQTDPFIQRASIKMTTSLHTYCKTSSLETKKKKKDQTEH